MRARRYALVAGSILIATLLAPPIIVQNSTSHQEIYRAFVDSYFEGTTANVAKRTLKFNAPADAILECAPSVFLTTAITRFYRTRNLSQPDLKGASARLVDPDEQTQQMMTLDPLKAIKMGMDPERAIQRQFDAGFVELSEVAFGLRGDRALMTYSFTCGATCGNGGVVLFERVDGRWTVSDKQCGPRWMS